MIKSAVNEVIRFSWRSILNIRFNKLKKLLNVSIFNVSICIRGKTF